MSDGETTLSAAIEDPWVKLKELIDRRDAEAAARFLDGLPAQEKVRAISRVSEEDQGELLKLIPSERAADLVEILPEIQAAELISRMGTDHAARVIGKLRSDRQAALMGRLNTRDADAILMRLDTDDAENVRALRDYAPGTAGGIMIREFLAYYHHVTAADVVADMRNQAQRYAKYSVQYAYVVNTRGELTGVLALRDLLFAPHDVPLSRLVAREPLRVRVGDSLEDLKRFFDEHKFVGVPVVDEKGRLVGVVEKASVEQAARDEAQSVLLKISGIIGGEEFRTMPLVSRAGRRLSWLSINIVLNLFAAGVIAMYTDVLEQVIMLAVFMPIISDMSGCSGNQSVAVSMRELMLGLVKPRELMRVAGKELGLGIINGIALGIMLGLIAWAWKGNPWLGLVVGGALTCNTAVSVVVGGLLPLILKRLRLDPAMVSGPMLTTVTDMCGFFLVLSFASMMLSKLVGIES